MKQRILPLSVQDRTTSSIAGLLILSGLLHLGLWMVWRQSWEGAVSLRKPALFGISSGLTLWSLGWVLSYLKSQSRDRFWMHSVAWCLLVEVGLITLQYWRGVASHFNHATNLDRVIELTMLALILVVTGFIGWICLRAVQPIDRSASMVLAIRAGLVWLLVSCLLGVGTTVLGHWNLANGRPPELWGQAGVLKFPHGVALHAIQLLPIGAWLMERWRWRSAYSIIQGIVAAQVCWLLYAVWQTMQGRSRFDLDTTSVSLLVFSVVCVAFPLAWNALYGRPVT